MAYPNQGIYQVLRRLQKLSGHDNTQLDPPPHIFTLYNGVICTEIGEQLDISVVLEFMNLSMASIDKLEDKLSLKTMALDKVKRLVDSLDLDN